MCEDMQVRNFSENTQKSYLQQVSLFARHFRRSPEGLGPANIRTCQVYLTNEKKLATRAAAHLAVSWAIAPSSFVCVSRWTSLPLESKVKNLVPWITTLRPVAGISPSGVGNGPL
jgi:hypothetical protein